MKSNYINYMPQEYLRSYGTNIIFEENNSSNQISFLTDIIYAGTLFDYSALHLSRYDIKVNNQAIDDNAYNIAYECTKNLYPITAFVKDSGEFVGIRTDDIEEKWNNNKAYLKARFKGKVAELYINEMENYIKDHEAIQKLVEKDLFYTIFFLPRYTSFNMNLLVFFPLIPFHYSILGKGSQCVCFNKDAIQLTHSGNLFNASLDSTIDNYSSNDAISFLSEKDAVGSYKIIFDVSVSNYLIDSITGDFKFKNQKNENVKILIKSFYLEDKIPESSSDDQEFRKIEQLYKKNTDKIWKRLFNIIKANKYE